MPFGSHEAHGHDIAHTLHRAFIRDRWVSDVVAFQGRIMLQSEGAEIFFRRVELHPLEKR